MAGHSRGTVIAYVAPTRADGCVWNSARLEFRKLPVHHLADLWCVQNTEDPCVRPLGPAASQNRSFLTPLTPL